MMKKAHGFEYIWENGRERYWVPASSWLKNWLEIINSQFGGWSADIDRDYSDLMTNADTFNDKYYADLRFRLTEFYDKNKVLVDMLRNPPKT